jgi:hypothetical protein
MARGDQLGRQWRIIQTLLTFRTGKSASSDPRIFRKAGLILDTQNPSFKIITFQ